MYDPVCCTFRLSGPVIDATSDSPDGAWRSAAWNTRMSDPVSLQLNDRPSAPMMGRRAALMAARSAYRRRKWGFSAFLATRGSWVCRMAKAPASESAGALEAVSAIGAGPVDRFGDGQACGVDGEENGVDLTPLGGVAVSGVRVGSLVEDAVGGEERLVDGVMEGA